MGNKDFKNGSENTNYSITLGTRYKPAQYRGGVWQQYQGDALKALYRLYQCYSFVQPNLEYQINDVCQVKYQARLMIYELSGQFFPPLFCYSESEK